MTGHVDTASRQISVKQRLRTDVARLPAWALDMALAALVTCVAVRATESGSTDWRYYESGQRELFGGSGWSLYAAHPVYQIGPLALAVARAVAALPGDGETWNILTTGLLLAPTLLLTGRAVRAAAPRVPSTRTWTAGRLIIALGWFPLTVIGQLGDALALIGVLMAMDLLRMRPVLAGVAYSLSVYAKPWTLVLVPVLLFAPARQRTWALGIAGTVGLISWGPFLAASASTMQAARPTFLVPEDAWQRVLGVGDAAPVWWRGLQLLVCWGLGIALWAVGRDRRPWQRWMVAAAGIIAIARLLTDLGTWPYYVSVAIPLVVAADMVTSSRALPVASALLFLTVLNTDDLLGAFLASAIRVTCLVAAGLVLLWGWSGAQRRDMQLHPVGGRP